MDTNHIQSSGKYETNSLVDRFNRVYTTSPTSLYGYQSNFNYQFVHLFYYNNIPTCTYFQNYIEPIYNLLKGKALIKIKTNLTSQTTDHILSGFDIDAFEDNYTSIFYINTNNGYTEFLDGTKIESRENRMLTFRGNCYHSGVSSTDQPARIVLNFNYFK